MRRALSKSHQEFFLPIAKTCSVRFKIVPICYILKFRKGPPTMGISMNSRTGGFRKGSEAHDPKIIGAPAVEAAVISAPELDPPVKTPEKLPHGPWLVPGAGTL